MVPLKKYFADIEKEMFRSPFVSLYAGLRRKYPLIGPYCSPEELLAKLHDPASLDYAFNDNVLSALIHEYQTRLDKRLLASYFLMVFKPGLLKLFFWHREMSGWSQSSGDSDLWSRIVMRFLEELGRMDIRTDRTKMASKVLGRLKNYLRFYFREEGRAVRVEHRIKMDPCLMSHHRSETFPEEIEEFLDGLESAGVISRDDKELLSANRLRGESMKTISQRSNGMSYASIRQRKSRAYKAIRAHLSGPGKTPEFSGNNT